MRLDVAFIGQHGEGIDVEIVFDKAQPYLGTALGKATAAMSVVECVKDRSDGNIVEDMGGYKVGSGLVSTVFVAFFLSR